MTNKVSYCKLTARQQVLAMAWGVVHLWKICHQKKRTPCILPLKVTEVTGSLEPTQLDWVRNDIFLVIDSNFYL